MVVLVGSTTNCDKILVIAGRVAWVFGLAEVSADAGCFLRKLTCLRLLKLRPLLLCSIPLSAKNLHFHDNLILPDEDSSLLN